MAELVGKRYAASLFEVGLELEKADDFHNQLNLIGKYLLQEKGLLNILDHPRIPSKEKKDVVDKIFGENLSIEVLNFLFIVIDKRRENNLIDIVEEYNKLFKDYRRILDVEAVTAVPMEGSAKDKLKEVLKGKFDKKINLSNRVDPSIIGGVMLNMDEKRIDSTLKNQLEEMELMFKDISL